MSFKITRTSGEYEHDSNLVGWLKDFAKTVEAANPENPATAVDRAREREREQAVYYASARGVLGETKRYSSVEDAVKDMQERTGLTTYLGKLSGKEENNVKKASSNVDVQVPSVLQGYGSLANDIGSFLNNNLKTNQNTSIIQLQDELLRTFRQLDLHAIYNDETAKYLSDKILQNKRSPVSENLSGLGKDVDSLPSNQNWMEGLMPTRQ